MTLYTINVYSQFRREYLRREKEVDALLPYGNGRLGTQADKNVGVTVSPFAFLFKSFFDFTICSHI
jgi:hypothetical protein